jgi:hypothetical protein
VVADVSRLTDSNRSALAELIERYGVELIEVTGADAPIPHTFWGEPEAGIAGTRIYVRSDTPIHSVLHELSHIVCMSAARRARLRRHAGGTAIEECAVCYLQILLADCLPGFGRTRCIADMDAWGYSFREGSAASWFAGDGKFAAAWLQAAGIIDSFEQPSWSLHA